MAKERRKPLTQRAGIIDFPDLNCDRPGVAPLNNGFSKIVDKKADLYEHKWKKPTEAGETPAAEPDPKS